MHRTTSLTILAGIFLLSACGNATTSIGRENDNPLTASRYGDVLADTMANLIIQNDPVVKEPGMKELIEKTITEGKTIAADGRGRMNAGTKGGLIGIKETVNGLVLLFPERLYLSSDFETKPGPDLHVFLTNAVDPREGEFPGATAMDLGPVQSAYGAQEYVLSSSVDPAVMRTLVLFDRSLKRLYSFAQLSK